MMTGWSKRKSGRTCGGAGALAVWAVLAGVPVCPAEADELRGLWADAFYQGFKSTSQIDTLVSRAVTGRYNAIFAEVLAYQDTGSGGHGAYWNSAIVPKATDISGGIDPLAYLVQQAHASGLEVHAWLVPYRVSTSWPPNGNAYLAARPQWIMVPLADMDTGPATIDGKYNLDPGSPEVQTYLVSIVRELVTNYAIDGMHWDYIRYLDTDAGYPAHAWYGQSGLERFRAIYAYGGTPPVDYGPWNDFRRREINELVRRALVEVHTNEANPQQPLRHTAALLATGDAPANFADSLAYTLFQDWKTWMQKGWLDAGCPMNYKREHCTDEAAWFRDWVTAALNWSYDRHVFCGQALYLNSFADSVTQMSYAYGQGVEGSVNFSYYATRATETICDANDPWTNDPAWYSYVAANLFTAPATHPAMSWHDPTAATKGAVYGRIADGATGQPIDNATFEINGFPAAQVDGNGFYVVTQLSAGPTGTMVPTSAVAPGYAEVFRPAVLVERAGFTEVNFALGTWLPGDYDVDADVDLDDYAHFASCLTGPGQGPLAAGCDVFDFDADADVDLKDYQVLQDSFTWAP
ncbi:MAG: family 10 glycosylhydrolase [Planctomycetota bacterium]